MIRYCNHCKKTKEITKFVKCKECKTGYRNICKDCKNAFTRKARNPFAKPVQPPKETNINIPNLVPPRTFIYTKESYKTEKAYYRNDGNKHIQSKGFRT